MNTILKWLTCCLMLLQISLQNAIACTIFMANDGNNVWVGNNEDDRPDKKYRLWYVPAKASTEHGYIIWAGILKGFAEKISHKFPEGGINEHGLFVDAAALPEKISIRKDGAKKDWKGYLVKDILKRCKTVQEALLFVSNYNLVEQEKAQIFIADASGDYAIVHANYIIKKETAHFALTNYCLNDGKQHVCWRQNTVNDMLKHKSQFDLSSVKMMLEKSAQTDHYNKTNFSIAANLKLATLHIFQHRDFKTGKTISVREALKKGKRSEDMVALFPKNISSALEKTLKQKGLEASVAQFKQLESAASGEYNFQNDDVVNFAIQLINRQKVNEALAFLKLAIEIQPDNTLAKTWLGIAAKLLNNDDSSSGMFSDVLRKEPQNYLANLFGNQENSKISFYLDHFENAQSVFLAGDFTDWKAKAVEMKKVNGVWFCTLEIPKGEHQYKFIVEDIWVTDPKNTLTGVLGNNVNSKLFVWQ